MKDQVVTRQAFVEEALRRLRTLLRFDACYVADVRDVLEDLASREIAEALGNDTLSRTIHGAPKLVKRIESLEGQLETLLAQAGTPRVGPILVPAESTDRMRRAPRVATVCVKGHPLSGENLRVSKSGQRICKTCQRAYMRAWSRNHRAAQKRMGVPT